MLFRKILHKSVRNLLGDLNATTVINKTLSLEMLIESTHSLLARR